MDQTESTRLLLPDLLSLTAKAVEVVDGLFAVALEKVRPVAGKNQFAAHGLAWFGTYGEALRQLCAYGQRMEAEGCLGELEKLLIQAGFGEYLWQLYGGIPLSQGEMLRPQDMGLSQEEQRTLMVPAVQILTQAGNTQAVRARIAELMSGQESTAPPSFGDNGLDETLTQIRDQIRRFTEEKILPHAHDWHLRNVCIPLDIITEMAGLGIFGLTIPEEFGGTGLGKQAMCVVSEELSRGYLGVGSLGTRSEIAAELILHGGTEAQRQRWLPGIARGETLPTAVFTEPDTGSDLASLTTRAHREGDTYKVTGAKTWITHAARADLMTLLVRTGSTQGYKGLSMLLAPKPRGGDANPFPAEGMSGSEIEAPGYRGMKEFEIAFDAFAVGAENLLGGEEGQGFRQLMVTFESARIQTAARAIGVARSALELGFRYARERKQFGQPIYNFPRVHGKLAMMAVEILMARQLTYHAAREKDRGRRCDLEAGMAKLLAARVAWAAADNGVQIHGGNGFALEYPVNRILCDARVLNIFEGSAEIQAQVIARRLLEKRN